MSDLTSLLSHQSSDIAVGMQAGSLQMLLQALLEGLQR